MTDKELIKFLRDHKDDPAFGGGDFNFEKSWNKFAEKYGFQKYSGEPYKITIGEYCNYFLHVGSKALVRPVSYALTVFAMVFGGWVVTVNASMASVPGDFLYPVKMATEKVQLTLAATNEQRARLHTEFASRRLDEVVEINSSSREGKEARVQVAVESFKQSISSANAAIGNLTTSSPEVAASVAIAVDQKVEVMTSVLNTNVASSDESSQQIVDAQNTVQDSDRFLTETIVSTNEVVQRSTTDEYLQDTFKKDIVEIQNLEVGINARLENIQAAMFAGRAPYDYSKNILVIKDLTELTNGQIEEAMSYFAAGGWRRVLEIVTDLKTKYTNAEALVSEMEIDISTNIIP